MKTTFSRRILVIFASATAYLAFTGVTHAHESGLLMGGLYSIGDDGAAEAAENPAFLATAKRTQGKSAHARTAAYNAGNIVVSALPVTNTTQVAGSMDLAMGWHRIAGSRWSAGLAFGDVRSPIYQRLALEGSQLSPLTGLNVSIRTLNVDQSHGLSAALAWHLTVKESLGLRLSYRHRYVREKENLIAPQNASVTFASELVSEQRAHQLHATLSYLYHAAGGDITLMAGNLGAQQGKGSFAYSTVISTSANAVVAATHDASAFATAATLDPFFLIGSRTRVLARLNLFFEAGAQPTLTQKSSDNFYRKDGSQKATVRRDTTREGDIAITLGTGIALNLSENIAWHSGVRYQTSKTRMAMFAEDNHSRYLENTSVRFVQASTGISWRRLAYTWQFGLSYQYQNVDLEKRSSYTDTGADKTSQSNVAIAVNTYGVFFAVAADF
jgi:opacity protein-like surface antigen